MLKASIAWSLKVSEQPEKVLEMVAHLEIVLLPLKELLTVGDLVLILQFFSFSPQVPVPNFCFPRLLLLIRRFGAK